MVLARYRVVLGICVYMMLALAPESGYSATPYFTDPFITSPFNCAAPTAVPSGSGLNGSMIYTHPDCPSASVTSSEGVTSTDSDGASWLWRHNPPTGREHETKVRFVLGSTGGTKLVYVGATYDARWKNSYSTQGNGYVVTMTTSSGYNGGIQANVSIRRLQYGYSVDLASFNVAITSTPTLRVVRTKLSGTWKILLHIDDTYVGSVIDSTYTTGSLYPGFGMMTSLADAYVDQVDHYAIEHGAPDNAALSAGLSHVAAPTYASFQWNPIGDSDGGSGYGPREWPATRSTATGPSVAR